MIFCTFFSISQFNQTRENKSPFASASFYYTAVGRWFTVVSLVLISAPCSLHYLCAVSYSLTQGPLMFRVA